MNKQLEWIKSKKAVAKSFDKLDYNRKIHASSYDLTLINKQNNLNKDAA